jgi:hypothetical protein
MKPRQAALMLEQFARGSGRDIGWQNPAVRLSHELADRIDRAAVGWLNAHQQTTSDAEEMERRGQEALARQTLPYRDE